MIDQASVFADRFRNNRQALQAAVLGQNSGVDPYTALRALQLLKESDSMQMAQQGQQPTEEPSLLQEAMQQPQGLAGMPTGQPVPGQQMPQAPQQSGGLEAMPVSDQMFSGAGGGIVAFANKGSVPAGDIVGYAGGGETLDKARERRKAAQQKVYSYGLRQRQQDPEGFQTAQAELQATQTALQAAEKSYAAEMSAAGIDKPISAASPMGAVGRFEKAQASEAETAAPPINNPLRAQEAAAGIPDGSSVVPATTPVFDTDTFLNNGTDMAPVDTTADPVNRGIGAIAQSQAMTDALAAKSTARAGLSAIAYNPPAVVEPQTATERFQGAKDQINNVKEYMGEDKYSAAARQIIEERTADLTNPDRNKFDKALAWFKGAAAMQKGRGLGSIANAAAEVAGSYSVIKKEDRKEKNAIRDMNLNLTKAEQAREDGQKSTAMNWQDKAQVDKVAADEARAKREEAKLRVETAVKGRLFESADKGVSSLMTNETQNRNIDSTAETARQRIKSDEKTRKQTAIGQRDYRDQTAFNAAFETLRRVEVDVDKAIKGDTELQRVITNITRNELKAAKGELDQKGLIALENSKAKRVILEKQYADKIKAAKERFNVISSRIMGAAGIGAGGNDQEAGARQWLKDNPNDPRAAAIRKKLGM